MIRMNDHSRVFLAYAENEVEKAIARSTIRVQREAKRLVSQHAGPIKSLPNARPSKPGEPPHKRTGTLGRSIDQETFRRDKLFVGRVGTNLDYGKWLELGTHRSDRANNQDGYYMAPRPYLRPSLDTNRNKIVAEIKAAGRRMNRGGA